jgi:hypothetical protein
MGATSLINANCKAMKDCEVLPWNFMLGLAQEKHLF